MSPRDLAALMPVIVPIIVVMILFVRTRPGREVRMRPATLWITPLLLGLFICSGLWFLPHPTLTPAHVAILVAATAAGIAFGLWRARGLTIRRSGRDAFVSTSRAAFVVIVGLLVARQLASYTGGGPPSAVATDAGMMFALGLILTTRLALWIRLRRLPSPSA